MRLPLLLAPLLTVGRTTTAEDPPGRHAVHEKGCFEGFTLFSPLLSKTTFLIDMDGAVVHRWETRGAPGSADYLLGNGNLLRCKRIEDCDAFHGGGIGGGVEEIDWEGRVVWDYTLASDAQHHHHDVEPLPNGNVLFIVWEKLAREEAIALGRDPSEVGAEGLWPDALLEVAAIRPNEGRIVWEWHVRDHLVQDRDPAKPGYGKLAEHPGLVDVNAGGRAGGEASGPEPDWLHTNSVDYDVADDLILLSSPRLSEIFAIDHATTIAESAAHAGGRRGHGGDLLWRYGNPANHGAGSAADRKLFAQHDARWIRPGCPGAGHVLVFNNGVGRPDGEYSSVDELALPSGDEKGSPELVWSYSAKGRFYADLLSGADRLPNGNTLVCSGTEGRIFEVTPEKAIVWEYRNPFGGEVPPSIGRAGRRPPPGSRSPGVQPIALFRATRIAPDHPALAGRGLTRSGGPP